MVRQFDGLFEMMQAFSDEQTCIDHLRAIRWANGAFCPYFSDRRTHKCGDCRQRFSIKVGTIFEGSKVPLRKWFMAIWLMTSHKRGVASTQLAKDIKVTQKTAWFSSTGCGTRRRPARSTSPPGGRRGGRRDLHRRQGGEQARA